MKLSAPIHILKSKAKKLKTSEGITLAEALDKVAKTEGYSSWSLLQSKSKDLFPKKKEEVLGYLNAGDLMLIGSRPGLGKTSFTLEMLVQAKREGRCCYFFTLEYTKKDIARKVSEIDENIGQFSDNLIFDFSDDISADYIIEKTEGYIKEDGLIVVDYLQLLDQKRSNPELQLQIEKLKTYAKEKKCIIVFISQLDRSFEEKRGARPSLQDVRLPNPVDLKLFNKTMFLHDGKKMFTSPAEFMLD